MKLTTETSEIWAPDGLAANAALARTTHMGIGAHQDDLEIMCLEGIMAGFGSDENWFCGVVVTDGAGSPRDGRYAGYDDARMKAVRRTEQKKAAYVGEYTAAVFLDHPSASVKDPSNPAPEQDIVSLMEAARPEVVYTHNPADKHPTHVAVAMRVVRALRTLPEDQRPRRVYGCEVWRDLDWMMDTDKVLFRLDEHENIANSLVGVFDSQIAGGKRYDLATTGRRLANATYHQSHSVDSARLLNFGMDLTPLIADASLNVAEYVLAYLDRFRRAVEQNLLAFR